MKKVYCKNCKFFVDVWTYYHNIIQCLSPQNIVKKDTYKEIVELLKKEPETINKNNNCKYYKRKWYKFSVK